MALKLQYYGQNDTQWSPDVLLTGDPGTDQQTLVAAGYLGGIVVKLATPATNTTVAAVVVPTSGATTDVPFGTLINGPGEFAGAIGPSGSKKTPIVRAMWQGNVNSESYDSSTFTLGAKLYAATAGKYSTTGAGPVGICTHTPTTAEPWLGVASLL